MTGFLGLVLAAGALLALTGYLRTTRLWPNLQQVLAESTPHPAAPPAHAGGSSPKSDGSRPVPPPTPERRGPVATHHQARASVQTAVLLDYRAVAAIALIILLLRRMSRERAKQAVAKLHARSLPGDDADDAAAALPSRAEGTKFRRAA